jgi:hypothetical protein
MSVKDRVAAAVLVSALGWASASVPFAQDLPDKDPQPRLSRRDKPDKPVKKPESPQPAPVRKPAARPGGPEVRRPAPAPRPAPASRPGAAPTPRVAPAPTHRPDAAPTPRVAPAPTHQPDAAPAPRHDAGSPPSPGATPARPTYQVSRSTAARTTLRPRPPVPAATRSYDPTPRTATTVRPVHRSTDVRYARPDPRVVRRYPSAPAPPPSSITYRTRYTHWWLHPYYRYTHVTYVVVAFPFMVDPWGPVWIPPPRQGWVWVPGYWSFGWWHPGHWRPLGLPPVLHSVSYIYVPGWWFGDVYVEGYYRVADRDGWVWVEGAYTADGRYIPGHWRPLERPPKGYVWEPGFYDGEVWVEGFWRPAGVRGFLWVEAGYDSDGLYRGGFWEPVEPRPGHVWIPGWFDGNSWQGGSWVTEQAYRTADPAAEQPDPGFDDGWSEPVPMVEPGTAPLAIGVDGLEPGGSTP